MSGGLRRSGDRELRRETAERVVGGVQLAHPVGGIGRAVDVRMEPAREGAVGVPDGGVVGPGREAQYRVKRRPIDHLTEESVPSYPSGDGYEPSMASVIWRANELVTTGMTSGIWACVSLPCSIIAT